MPAPRLARKVASDERGSRLLCRLNRRARILMLHEIGTPEYPIAVFRAQLHFLSRIFRFVPLTEVLQPDTAGSNSLPKLALTFDDGLKNNFTAAYPVLREFHVPATFFVCPGLVQSGRWLWNHECRARLSRMSLDARCAFAEELGIESGDIEAIVHRLKYLPNAKRLLTEDRLRLLTPTFRPTDLERLRYDLMDWDDLKALDPALISIGGHSSHHEILTRLEGAHLEAEVAGCRAWLERELERAVPLFCYPDGAYNSQVTDCVGRHFELAVTTEKDWVPRHPSRLKLPRIPIGENLPDLAWRVHWPNA